MININLLPWREEQREKQKRMFFSLMALTCLLTIVLLSLIHLSIGNDIERQMSRNAFLQAEINKASTEIGTLKKLQQQKDKLQEQLDLLLYLNNNRYQVVRTLDDLVKVLPHAVYLTGINYKDNKVTLTGIAQNNVQVAQFMQNISSKSAWMVNPVLNEISLDKDNKLGYGKTFQLQFQLK